jgi:DNA-binding transcriptional MocR family regulator
VLDREDDPAGAAADDGERLYRQVACRVENQIRTGLFRPGERVPSVRRLAAQLGISIGTAIAAYRLLEDSGLLEVRPQSGYYVRLAPSPLPAEPRPSQPSGKPAAVSATEFAWGIMKAMHGAEAVPLGQSSPHPALLPIRQLDRIASGLLRRDSGAAHRYDYPPGLPALRRQIARRLLDAGCDVSPDDIVLTSGCREAVTVCLRAVARAGDVIAVESPTYYGTLQAIEALGMKALEIPTHPRDGINLDVLEFALERHRIKACALVLNFGNPLGACMPEANKRKLVRLLAQHDVPLIEDDVAGDLAFAAPRPKLAKAFDRMGLVLSCASFSKTLSPGFRVGWAVPGRYRTRVEHLKYVSSIAAPTLPAMALAEFLARGGYERHLRGLRFACAQNAQRLQQAVTRHFPAGTRLSQPSGGFLSWVEFPPTLDALELHRRALAHGISIAPGPLFSAKQKYRHCARLTFALPWDQRTEQALVRLGRIASELA